MVDSNDAAWAVGFVKRADSIGIIPEAVPDLMQLAVQLDGHKQAQAVADVIAPHIPATVKSFGTKTLSVLDKFFAPDPVAVAMQRANDVKDIAWRFANRPKPAVKQNVYVRPS